LSARTQLCGGGEQRSVARHAAPLAVQRAAEHRVDQHHGAHPLRMGRGEVQRHLRAEAVTDEDRLLDAIAEAAVQQGGQIIGSTTRGSMRGA
jgi:hypothetical protein